MAESPPINEALLREVDDAVRQDRLLSIWERFGRWIIVLVIVGLAAFGGWLYWEHHSKQSSGATAEQAQEVLRTAAQGGKPDAKALEQLSDASQPGYRAIAMLTKAGAAAEAGDTKGAAKLYGEIAADAKLDQPYRDLATIRRVALSFEEMKPQQVIDTLKPLAVEGNPWFGSAGEMTAIAYMKMGKKDVAGPIFAALAKDEQVPQTLRARARQMAGLMGIDAVETEEDGNKNGQEEAGDATTGE
ncbi:MAG: tetratricopeptide repeat protein [Sphingobium sp.]